MNRPVLLAVVVLALLAGCSDRPLAVVEATPAPTPAAVPAFAFEADFAGQPDGPPLDPRIVRYDNSRDTHYAAAPDSLAVVVDGALQSPATEQGLSSSYLQVDLGSPVARIGAEFTFTAGGAPGGALALPVWAEPFDQTWPRLPDSPSHVVLTRNDWAYQVVDDGSGRHVMAGVFDPPLPADTLLRIDIRLAGGSATLELPDGSTQTVTDPMIVGPANYATFESFQMDAATMARVRFVRIWADTLDPGVRGG